MKLRIVVIWRGAVEALPPAMALVRHLASVGHDVTWISGTATETTIRTMATDGVKCTALGIPSTGYEPAQDKAVNALRFRLRASREIERVGRSAVLWVMNTETAIVLGRRLLQRSYVLQLYELHEARIKRWLVHPYVRGARVVIAAERNRAGVLRHWHRLASTPVVIPNAPSMRPIENRRAHPALQASIAAGKRIALYQGLIRADRDLSVYCRVFANRSRWQLVLMGRDFGCVDRFASMCPTLIHIDHIDAPRHLEVTSSASLGLVTYNDDCLNNRFCAPNKVYEYGAFGIPVLANTVPGLVETVGQYGAGICAPPDAEQVSRAIDSIELNYDAFARGSRELANDATAAMHAGARQVVAMCERHS